MKILIATILLTVSFVSMADTGYGYRTKDAYERATTPPQPMYFDQKRLQDQKELNALKESNDIAREQLQLERQRIADEDFQRKIDSHE